MPREDYDKFIEIAKTELPSYLELFNAVNSTHSDIHFLKLHDNRTMFTADILLKYPDCYTGIFIDIEPVDSAPTDSKEREKWYYEVDRLYCYDLVRKFGKTYLYPDTMEWIYPNRVKRAIAYYLLHLFPSDFSQNFMKRSRKELIAYILFMKQRMSLSHVTECSEATTCGRRVHQTGTAT